MKKFFPLFLILSSILFISCQNKEDINLNELSNDLLTNTSITDELTQINDTFVEKLYKINTATEQYVFVSTGATAEEIALFKFETNEEANVALSLAQNRINYQMESYESYNPNETYRLKNAIVKQYDCYVVVCVLNSDEASIILQKYF